MDHVAPPEPTPACILVLQGGGAMGAYHIGAFQALSEYQFSPDWVCGISIGAINGAIIAGNAAGQQIERLDQFWDSISRPWLLPSARATTVRSWQHALSFAETLMLGQPGFFRPRPISPYLTPPGPAATSFYDTTPLIATLARLVDFRQLNAEPGRAGATRLSVGATDVETGGLVFFDTRHMDGHFGPEHVMASGALPPGFPPIRIGGRAYWDGGCVSNSPLQAVLDDTPEGHVVVFVIDLWSASGPLPDSMAAVAWRAKQIRYASDTPHDIGALAAKLQLRRAAQLLDPRSPASPSPRIDLVHIIYHPAGDEIPSSDAEFSRPSIAARRAAGLHDMRAVLAARPWHRPEQEEHLGCLVHRVTPDGITTL